MFNVTSFEENKFYIATGRGEKWSDYDGSFDAIQEAIEHLVQLCGDNASPEMVNSAVITHFQNNMLDLVKDDNGLPIDGKQIHWKNTIWYQDKIIWESNENR